MTHHNLRRARDADVPAIERLVHDAFGHYVERIGRPPPR
jgi:N-acetylglutamate synthase-like GNAT family acetyltransferase